MAGAVGDEGDQIPRVAAESGFELVDEVAELLDEVEIGFLVVTTDVVGFTGLA